MAPTNTAAASDAARAVGAGGDAPGTPGPGTPVVEPGTPMTPGTPVTAPVVSAAAEESVFTFHSGRSLRTTVSGGTGATPTSPGARHTHELHHVKRTRLLEKNGTWNISYAHQRRRRTYISDIFTTIVEAKWRYTLLSFALGFLLSWVFFAIIWYVICLTHGDFDQDDAARQAAGFKPCVMSVYSFTSVLLFSIETQHTIGYGSRHITEECVEAIIVLIIQSTAGVLIQCIVAGMVFSKIARPKRRAETVVFSKNAVICLRDGKLCFLYRVGDMRKTHLLGSSIQAEFVRKRVTAEGEVIPLHQTRMKVGLETESESIFMIWPVIVCHYIDEDSPLYSMSQEDLAPTGGGGGGSGVGDHFEIIVTLDGAVQSNGMPVQARSSYLPTEVLWGYRFKRMLSWHRDSQSYQIDHRKFHACVPVPCPAMSARDIREAGGIQAVPIERSMTKFMNMMLSDLGTPAGTPEPSPTLTNNNRNGGTATLRNTAAAAAAAHQQHAKRSLPA